MKRISYGQIAGTCLLLSLVSGFIVGYQYEVATPLISTTAIEAVLPFGWFWRALHFWTSQAFVIMLCLHCFDTWGHMNDAEKAPATRRHWSLISITIPIAILALFSGYVLRFDSTGQAAGAIAEHLLLNVPWFGKGLDRLFMAINTEGLNRRYIVHILAGTICWFLGTWYHTRTVRMGFVTFSLTTLALLSFSMLVRAPLELPQPHSHLIKGPWFFLGIQELLRNFDPLIAGILFPAIPFATIAILPWLKKRQPAYLILLMWTFGYAGITLMGILRTG